MIRSREVLTYILLCWIELVSNSELLCSVDFCHYDAMLKAKNMLKSFQIRLLKYTREEANSREPVE